MEFAVLAYRPTSQLAQSLSTSYRRWRSGVKELPMGHHRCYVSLKLCCPGAKSWTWASTIVRCFSVTDIYSICVKRHYKVTSFS